MSAAIKLECLKIAATLTSPSAGDRVASVMETAEVLYNFVFSDNIQNTDTPDMPKKRERPRSL